MDGFTSHPSSFLPTSVLTAVFDGPSDSPFLTDPSIAVAPDVPMRGPSLRRAIHSWSHLSHPQVGEKDKDIDHEPIDRNSVAESGHNCSAHKLATANVWSHLLYFHFHSKTHEISHQPREREKDASLESKDKNSTSKAAHAWSHHHLYFHSHSKSRDKSKHLEPPSSHSHPKEISSTLEPTAKDPPLEPAVGGPSLESTVKSPSFESSVKSPSLESKDENIVPELVKRGPVHDSVTKQPVLKSPSTHSLPQFLYFQSHSRPQNKPPKEKNPEVESISSHSNWPHLLYFQSHSRSSLHDRRSLRESSSKVKHSINPLSLEIFKPPKEEKRLYYGKRVVDMFQWVEAEDVGLKAIHLQDSIPCSILIGTHKINSVEYILHKTLLCQQSPYFRNAFEEHRRKRGSRTSQYEQYPTVALNEQETQDLENEDGLHLPGTSRPIFDLLVRWLYHIESTWTANNAHLLLQLYVLADKFGIEALKDDCVDFIIPLVSSEYRFHGLDIAYVYLNTSAGSALRKLMVRIVGYHIKNEKLLDRSGEWETSIMRQISKNGEFAKDLVRALAETDEKLVRPEDEWGCKWHGHGQ